MPLIVLQTESVPLSPWFLPLFPLFFAGMWMMVMTLLAHVGGWRTLARHYPGPGSEGGKTFWGASASLGSPPLPMNYGGCLNIRVAQTGVGMLPSLMFRFQHPPIFIPFSEVESCEPGRRWFRTVVELLPRDGPPVMLHGRAGRAVLEAWTTWQSRAPAPA